MKYVVVNEDTCDIFLVQTTSTAIDKMVNEDKGFHIVRQYDDNVAVSSFTFFAANVDCKEWTATIYGTVEDCIKIFKELYPEDTILSIEIPVEG